MGKINGYLTALTAIALMGWGFAAPAGAEPAPADVAGASEAVQTYINATNNVDMPLMRAMVCGRLAAATSAGTDEQVRQVMQSQRDRIGLAHIEVLHPVELGSPPGQVDLLAQLTSEHHPQDPGGNGINLVYHTEKVNGSWKVCHARNEGRLDEP
ncbi:hypothetical protein BKG83_04405 [Mycobacteroides chelonae]|uniref:DUF4878 domain-containing protein n=1 Tax=Mycobacteroides chelonae TaxID=1774 RepID=A0A1S1KUR7_MYCCH|nr:hypothetical protein [Mycobacteroides chelonae]PKQ55389.1 hypothetical protein B5566_24400 [Mycobacterium sp. MHSD3]SKO40234.1 Uncharacterised protein [Mycobacteroides abscessus subsp. bolletii]AYM43871.1 hypothetical protein DYE20_22170 [[Mycobacterium] chelonae subsp. gwanakae]MBF9523470.1 hypothetical protein [Mycobacteroides chelonae]OHU15223.1 hypothetical protein BKG75_08725 [Mycobacteroides chelonae]